MEPVVLGCLARTFLGVALCVASGCASAPRAPAEAPHRDGPYPGPCSSVALEAYEQPSPGRGSGPDNLGTGTVEVVASYRPGRRATPEPRVGYFFRTGVERADNVDAQFQQHAEVVCGGESPNRN